jgi:hypothetical protein
MGRRTLSIFVVLLLIISVLSNGMIVMMPLIKIVEAADIPSWTDTNTTINVTVILDEPVINWYDFQNATDVSKLNEQVDIEQQYKFRMNITSYQGWGNIKFINITAWHDNGSEATVYNQTGADNNHGGNRNMILQYENSSGTGESAVWRLIWPDDEVGFNSADCSDIDIDTNTHNLTFVFTPGNQTRYAPDPTNTASGYNDLWSWNFNITAEDNESYIDYKNNEYGIFMYSHISQVTDNPTATGVPGQSDIQLSPNATITTQCNTNYTLTTEVPNLSRTAGGDWIDNKSLYAAGGNLSKTNYSGFGPLYIWGTATTYRPHENDTVDESTIVDYWVDIDVGTLQGYYEATVTYTINGQ